MTPKNDRIAETLEQLRRMTPEAFQALGMPELAYVRPVEIQAKPAFAVFAADGTRLGEAADRRIAFAAARQHGLEPVSVH